MFSIHWKTALALVFLLLATGVHAKRLMEIDGIELRGTARVLTYGAATCHVREANHSEEEYERLKVNEGKPLDLWQLDFSVHNGSGKALDHLIARYGIESEWPPCTNWKDKPESPTTGALWADEIGHIQRTGKPYSVAPGETLTEEILFIVFHEDAPRFANWSVDYNFAEGTPAVPDTQPAQTKTQPPAEQPAQTQAAATQPTQAPGLPDGVSAEDTCAGKAEGSACWMELDNRAGCYVWNGHLSENETVTWSGGCTGGLAEGTGEIVWVWGSDRENSVTDTGRMQQGKKHGQWVVRRADGDVYEGPYVGGKRHGQWVERHANGDVYEGPYVDGKRHGQWVFRLANGGVQEGPFVDGKHHGQWVLRFADGRVLEGPLVDGKWHGQWIQRWADGGVWEGPFVGGKRHGQWVIREADGDVKEGPYVDGKRHGQWVERHANGDVYEGPYVDGKRHGQWDIREADGSIDIYQYVDGDANGHWVNREPEEVRALLKTGVDVNATFYVEAKMTALHVAAYKEVPAEVIVALLEAGADVNAKRGIDGNTPLGYAVGRYVECDDNNFVATVKILLEAGANARYRYSDGSSIMHRISAEDCSSSTVATVISMLISEGGNIHARDEGGDTPLHTAAVMGRAKATSAFINAGADINRKNDYGQTALHMAVRAYQGYDRDQLEISYSDDFYDNPEEHIQDQVSEAVSTVKVLLSSGADPTARDANGRTPLDYIGDNSVLKNTDIYWELRDAQRSQE